MLVRDLIELLSNLNQDSEVFICNDEGCDDLAFMKVEVVDDDVFINL